MATYLLVITDTHFGQINYGRSGPLQANPDFSTSASADTQEPPLNQATAMEYIPSDYLHSSSGQLLSQSYNTPAEGHGELYGVMFHSFSSSNTAMTSESAFAFSQACKVHEFTAFSMSANA